MSDVNDTVNAAVNMPAVATTHNLQLIINSYSLEIKIRDNDPAHFVIDPNVHRQFTLQNNSQSLITNIRINPKEFYIDKADNKEVHVTIFVESPSNVLHFDGSHPRNVLDDFVSTNNHNNVIIEKALDTQHYDIEYV